PGPSKSAETLLVRREGNEVVFLNALRFQPDSALNLRFPLMNERLPAAMAALGKEGVMEGTDYRGAEVIAALRAVPDSPWSLVARMDKAEVYAPLWERLRQTLLVLTALITASGAGLAAAWRRQRLGDFRRLEESAQALRAGERLLREIAANYPRSYISIIEKDMTVGFTSGQEFRKRGLNPEDFVGLTLEQVFGDKASFVREHYLRAFDGREAEFELFFDGQHQLYRAIPLADERGRIPRILAVVENITDRKRQESEILAARDELKRLLDVAERARRVLLSVVEDQKASEEEVRKLNVELERRVRDRTAQLESANKELEAFAYSASHDLRAPLRGIDGWSLALLEDYHHRLDDKARGFLERIRAETQRMGRLIDDLLHFSRETRGELNMQAVDMTALAETVVARLVGEHPAAEVRIVIRPGLKARGDARLLEIVLVNLLDNALKFSRSRTPALVEFGRSDRDGRGVFFIRDNGVGFDMTYADKLFKVFQRLHGASEFPGSGIGLATVRNIISRHGGRIWAEAEPGAGA
ncbi:MAG: hypothetical protein FJY83_11965, partial [Candidatus Aminicenantes bacterium]|nr:hypothetical protein [Candidatus Aminicenantes bacterium]